MPASRLATALAIALSLAVTTPADAGRESKAPTTKVRRAGERQSVKRGPGRTTRRSTARTAVRNPTARKAASPGRPKVFRPKRPLAVGVIGLSGKGNGIARRLLLGGHTVVGLDASAASRAELVGEGALDAASVGELVERLPAAPGHRVVWLAGPVGDDVIAALGAALGPGDVVIDSSSDDLERTAGRAKALAGRGVELVDVGVSGEVDGYQRGYGLAVGGDARAVGKVKKLFQSVAPGARRGWAHITDDQGRGVAGGGHLVRTVEGAVDNAFRVALREGLDVLARGRIDVDPRRALGAWEQGSILTSELVGATLDLVSETGSYASVTEADVGPGQKTYNLAVDNGTPSFTLSSALFEQLHDPKTTAQKASVRGARRAQSGSKALDRKTPTVYRPRRPLTVGVVGLGRIGNGVSRRLLLGGHQVVGYDVVAEAKAQVAGAGGTAVDSLEELVASLPKVAGQPRAVFVYLKAGELTDTTITRLSELLDPGDIIIDGGNSQFTHTIDVGKTLAARGIELVDIGTSGGILGYQNGYAMMVGGSNRAVAQLTPALESLAPGKRAGWAHIRDRQGHGIPGGGHFVKMVHNAVEYAWMASLAEGLDVLGRGPSKIDRRTALKVWDERGPLASLITSITRRQLDADPTFDKLSNKVPDTGEGRWTVRYAADQGIPVQTLSAGVQQRLSSQVFIDDTTDIGRIQGQQRRGFGGHQPVTTR